jgi:hypothetical protein
MVLLYNENYGKDEDFKNDKINKINKTDEMVDEMDKDEIK